MKMLSLITIICLSIGSFLYSSEYISETYLQDRFTRLIDKKEVKLIIELGSYSGNDAAALHLFYNCPVYTFEADPCRYESIRKNIRPFPDVTLVPLGVWDETKNQKTFYQTEFSGAASFYTFNLPGIADVNHISVKELVARDNMDMNPITVTCTRLDDWIKANNLNQVDLLCIDIQGATLNALRGMGKYIETVKYIITEIEHKSMYTNEPLFPEINAYLESKGFTCLIEVEGDWGDVMFINNKLLKKN